MGMGAIKLGQRLLLKGASMRIVRQIDTGLWALEDLSSGRFSEHATLDLLRAWSHGDLTFPRHDGAYGYDAPIQDLLNAYGDAFRLSYPPEAWAKARTKLEFVMRLQKAPITQSILKPQIQEIWQDDTLWKAAKRPKKAPSWSSVANWLRKYRQADRDVRALMDRSQERGNRVPRFSEGVLDLVDDVIETRYLTPERPTYENVLEDIRGRIDQLNKARPASKQLEKPSKALLKRRIARLPAFDVYAARYGLPAARIKFRASRDGISTSKPLERVAMDHYRMNLFVVDEEAALPLGRPWLTLLLDESTRYVVGYYIHFDEPSNVSVARAIRHAIAPKILDSGLDFKREWDAWGVIDEIIVDNGLELHGETMEQGCAFFGTKIQYCPRKKPWYKGKIERFFRTIDQTLTSSIEGKTFENIFERGDYDPSEHAVITLTTLRQIVEKWIVDYYHQKYHRSLGTSPARAWEESIAHVDRYLPPSSMLLEAAFSKSEMRRLTKDGIEYDSLFYQSEDLRRLRESMGSEIDVNIRVMDDDLGWLLVVVPESKTVVRVVAVNEGYANGLTRWQHKVCKRYKRLRYQRDGVDLELFEAKALIRELIARDTGLVKRAGRARQKRFMGNECLASPKAAASPTSQQDVGGEDRPQTPAASAAKWPSATKPKVIPRYAPIIRSDPTLPSDGCSS